MNATYSYRQAAQAYAEGTRAFFAPGPVARGERAGAGPVPILELTSRAEGLAPLSAGLTQAAAAQLAAEDTAERLQASTALLAKALTDLEISRVLLQAAEEPEGEPAPTRGTAGAERSTAVERPRDLEENLRLLLGEEVTGPERTERGAEIPTSVAQARTQLAGDVDGTLGLIRDRAAKTGKSALGGLTGLGVGELAQAAGVVGMEIAQALGQAEQATRLVQLFRNFLSQAYGSLVALLGPAIAQTAANQAITWVKDAVSDEKFARLVDKLYETEPTGKALAKVVTSSNADLVKFIATIQGVEALDAAYRKQVDLVEKLLKGIKFVGAAPAAALPHGRLLLAAAYILVGGYIILAGADYVDAERLKLLDRVPGVRRVVETNLAGA